MFFGDQQVAFEPRFADVFQQYSDCVAHVLPAPRLTPEREKLTLRLELLPAQQVAEETVAKLLRFVDGGPSHVIDFTSEKSTVASRRSDALNFALVGPAFDARCVYAENSSGFG